MGCDNLCGMPHPNACRQAMKNRECDREGCRFFHIKGTKWVAKTMDNQNRNKPNTREEGEIRTEDREQVFLKAQSAMLIAITRLHDQMAEMQRQFQPGRWLGEFQTTTQRRQSPRMWDNQTDITQQQWGRDQRQQQGQDSY